MCLPFLLPHPQWAVVFAQLLIGGTNHGIHGFLVPIRNKQVRKPVSISGWAAGRYTALLSAWCSFDCKRLAKAA